MSVSRFTSLGFQQTALLLESVLHATFLVLILTSTTTGALGASNNFRVTCKNIRGMRLLYQDNELGPPQSNKHLTMSDDKISGGKIEILFSLSGKQAVLTEYGNENTGNALTSINLAYAGATNDMLTFWGFDHDGKAELITLYPKLGKGIWTTHNDRIAYVDRLALEKSFMMDCISENLGD